MAFSYHQTGKDKVSFLSLQAAPTPFIDKTNIKKTRKMQMSYKRRIFRNEVVMRFSEDDRGIYIVQKNNEIVFIGASEELREDILDRLTGMHEDQVKLTFYSCLGAKFNPLLRAEELLQKYRESYGRMPEFNEGSLIPDPLLLN